MSPGRIIRSRACLEEGARALVRLEPRFAPALAEVGALPLRLKPDGFGALSEAIVAQQVSVASARAIIGRMQAAGQASAPGILAASDEDLRASGLSRPKIGYLRALAAADLDYAALRGAPDDEVIAALVAQPGIGPWTAEIYAMLSLGRADVFAPGDLALAEAARILFDLPGRPGERAFRAMAAAWSPWRSIAARCLWAYYRVVKKREGIE